jgi:hypothetical protein
MSENEIVDLVKQCNEYTYDEFIPVNDSRFDELLDETVAYFEEELIKFKKELVSIRKISDAVHSGSV